MEHELREVRGHSFLDRFDGAPVLVDLGANVGKFTTEFLALYPTAHVLMVEGDPYLTAILQQSLAGSPNIRLFAGLVGAQSCTNTPFFLCKVPEGNSIFARFSNSWAPGDIREIRVERISLSDLLRRSGFEKVDLLKIDIEGSEWELLGGLTECEARVVRQITVEFHDFMAPELRPRTEECIERLQRLGYAVRCRPTHHVHGSPYFDCLFWREDSPEPALGPGGGDMLVGDSTR